MCLVRQQKKDKRRLAAGSTGCFSLYALLHESVAGEAGGGAEDAEVVPGFVREDGGGGEGPDGQRAQGRGGGQVGDQEDEEGA